jgi:gliding motility-associated-like protein
LGANVEYFVRARKLNSVKISSSSNMSPSFTSGKSVSPTNTKIKQVTNNQNEKLSIEIVKNPVANYLSIELRRVDINGLNESIYTFTGNETLYTDVFANNKLKYNYYILSKNMCGMISDSSQFSNNIVLDLLGENDKINLNWNSYFTWNTGVKDYTIFRASANNVIDAVNFTAEGLPLTDTSIVLDRGAFAANCFYIEARDNSETFYSKSNTSCYAKSGKVFYPNAIMPNGINRVFSFVGEGLDLQNSSISIYNRWGQIEYQKDNIEGGWNATNNSGNEVSTGVYFFMAKVKVGQEIIDIHGSITVIR